MFTRRIGFLVLIVQGCLDSQWTWMYKFIVGHKDIGAVTDCCNKICIERSSFLDYY